MEFGKAKFNLEALVGLDKKQLKEVVKGHNIKPHSLDDVVNDLYKAIPKLPKEKK